METLKNYKIHGVKAFKMYNCIIECDIVEYVGNDTVILWKGGETVDTIHNVYYFEVQCIDGNTDGFFSEYLDSKIGVR